MRALYRRNYLSAFNRYSHISQLPLFGSVGTKETKRPGTGTRADLTRYNRRIGETPLANSVIRIENRDGERGARKTAETTETRNRPRG